jgi:hypothetical protein
MRATLYVSIVAMLGLIGCGPTTTSNNTNDNNRSATPTDGGVAPVLPDSGSGGGTTPPATGGTTAAPGDANPGSAADPGPGARSDRSDSAVGVDDKRPDNTSVNKRDRDDNAKTPIDQDENQADVKMTADIRKTIVNTEGMSVNARNVKIITSQGKVTLRGPVASADEKQKIEKFATDVAGEGNVDSQLEVAE